MIISVFIHKIKQLFLLVISVIRSALCCFRRRRKSDADIVPLTAVGVIQDRQISTNQTSNENWENWGHGDTVREQIEDYRFRQQVKQPIVPEPPPEFYFQDMEPQIKTQAKVLIKTEQNIIEKSSRLSLNSDILPVGAELEAWDESKKGWEEAEDWNINDKKKEGRRSLGVKLS